MKTETLKRILRLIWNGLPDTHAAVHIKGRALTVVHDGRAWDWRRRAEESKAEENGTPPKPKSRVIVEVGDDFGVSWETDYAGLRDLTVARPARFGRGAYEPAADINLAACAGATPGTPEPAPKLAPVGRLTLDADTLRFVFAAAMPAYGHVPEHGQDDDRPHLQAIELRAKQADLTATDGHRLHRITLPAGWKTDVEALARVAVPAHAVRWVLGALDLCETDTVRVEVLAETYQAFRPWSVEPGDDGKRFRPWARLTVQGAGFRVVVLAPDNNVYGVFPNSDHVIPPGGAHADVVVELANVKELRAVTVAKAKKVNGDVSRPDTVLRVNGALAAQARCFERAGSGDTVQLAPERIIDAKVSDHAASDFRIGIVSRYLTEALPESGPAVLSFGGNLDPVRVDWPDGRIAVVMPFRLG